MKIRSVRHNNRKKAFEVRTSAKTLVLPYSKAAPSPTIQDPIAELFVDPEVGREAFTYVLQSGRSGTVHVDQVLELGRCIRLGDARIQAYHIEMVRVPQLLPPRQVLVDGIEGPAVRPS